MKFLVTIIQFLAGLSIIVGIHELGHLLFAKVFKMRVNSYTIGFPPKIFKIKWGETEYAIGSIPLGGAVQIAGMIDESLEKDQLSSAPQPWEFRSKPAWQRCLVILGGIFFNLISATLIYIGMAYHLGNTYIPKNQVNKYGIMPYELGIQMGFKEGDKIIKINGKDFENFSDIYAPHLLLKENSYYTIERDGKLLDLSIPEKMIEYLLDKKTMASFVRPIVPCLIQEVESGQSAHQAGLVAGDQIIACNNQVTLDFTQLLQMIPFRAGKVMPITYIRNGKKEITTITVSQDGKLGVTFKQEPWQYETYTCSLGESIHIGLKQILSVAKTQILSLWKIITGKLAIKKTIGGPIAIAQMFGHTFIWSNFLGLIASLSVVISIFNALPLPALDGGHALFLLWEMLSGRKPSDNFTQTIQKLGMLLLLAITLYALYNDIVKIFLTPK